MASPFTAKTLAFLRALKRNNDREWFRSRKADYEQHVLAPMHVLLTRLATDFRTFAPDLVAESKVSLFRIYRDTRFSEDKSPLKTHIGAHFPSRRFPKGRGAGLYVEIAPGWVWMGGGLYMPDSSDLRLVRAAIVEDPRRLKRIVTAQAFTSAVGGLEGAQLTRVPRGFPADHPAAEYLKFKQFIGGREWPAQCAVDDAFYPRLLEVFRAVAPLVTFLNDALSAGIRQAEVWPPVGPHARR